MRRASKPTEMQTPPDAVDFANQSEVRDANIFDTSLTLLFSNSGLVERIGSCQNSSDRN
jgi:hypothetical protein